MCTALARAGLYTRTNKKKGLMALLKKTPKKLLTLLLVATLLLSLMPVQTLAAESDEVISEPEEETNPVNLKPEPSDDPQ